MFNEFLLQRRYMLFAAAAGILGTFLPWFNAPFVGSVSGTASWNGWIAIALFVTTIYLVQRGDRKKLMDKKEFIIACSTSGFVGVVALYRIISFHISVLTMPEDTNAFAKALSFSFSLGVGIYIVALAGIAVVAVGMKMKKSHN